MKSHISVLIAARMGETGAQLEERLDAALEPHRFDEEHPMQRRYFWDYWYFPQRSDAADPGLQSDYPLDSADLLRNASRVHNLPADYYTSGVILENGSWHDPRDFGWRMMAEPSAENDRAVLRWTNRLRELLAQHRESICIQVIVHS